MSPLKSQLKSWPGFILPSEQECCFWTELTWTDSKPVFSSFQDSLKVYWQSCLFLSPATVQSSLLQSLSLPPTSPFPCLHNETSKWENTSRWRTGLSGFEDKIAFGCASVTRSQFWALRFCSNYTVSMASHLYFTSCSWLRKSHLYSWGDIVAKCLEVLYDKLPTCSLCLLFSAHYSCLSPPLLYAIMMITDILSEPWRLLGFLSLPLTKMFFTLWIQFSFFAFALYADIHFIFTHVWFLSF